MSEQDTMDPVESEVMTRSQTPDPSVNARSWTRQLLLNHPGAYVSRHLALYVASIKKSNPDEYAGILQEIRTKGGRIAEFNRILKEEKLALRQTSIQAEKRKKASTSIYESVDDDSMPETDLQSPTGYQVDESGVAKLGYGTNEDGDTIVTAKPICPEPAFVSAVIERIEDGSTYLEITHRHRNMWRKVHGPKQEFFDKNAIKKYAGKNLHVGSHNAGEMAEFFAKCESHNQDSYGDAFCSRTIGWNEHLGVKGFLLDNQFDYIGDKPLNLQYMPVEGDQRDLWESFRSDGNIKDWQETMMQVMGYPMAYFGLLASFAAPLAYALNTKNFLIDWSGDSGTSKTITIAVAASVWGYFNTEREGPKSLKRTWSGSAVARERSLSSVRGLPMFFDDTKTAEQKEHVSSTVYGVANGAGKQRATATGLQARNSFDLILFSTGESPLVEFTRDEGVRRRVIQLSGPPFGGQGLSYVQPIADCVMENYGLAGPEFVRKVLLPNHTKFAQWKNEVRTKAKKLADVKTDVPPGVLNSLAECGAVIELAGELVHEYGILPGDFESPVPECLWQAYKRATTADQSVIALQHLVGVIAGNSERIRVTDNYTGGVSEKAKTGSFPPHAGYWAARSMVNSDPCLSIAATEAQRILKESGFDVVAATEAWARRGWLALQPSSRSTTQATVQINPWPAPASRAYAIKDTVINDKVEG